MSELYIGIMSGTSLDGVDIALCEFTNENVHLSHFENYDFDDDLKQDILRVINETTTLKEIGLIDDRLGQMYAKCINNFLHKFEISSKDIKAIGLHGQTVWHEPIMGFSMQLGNPNRVAAQCKIPVVCDIRRMDMASGGQGAPFAPLFHKFLFGNLNKKVAVVNIGGMANISILGDKLIGYDTGCGNVLMDSWCSKYFGLNYDKNGNIARSGKVIIELITNMLQDAYFNKSYPKSTGREYFNLAWVEDKLSGDFELKDILRTLTELTANSIVNEAKKFDIDEIILCGGGAKNGFLMQRIGTLFGKDVKTTNDYGIREDAIEAMMMAYFAFLRIHKIPAELSSITGAKENLIVGGLYEPN
jgi:anhydro-N-acetylmuramic acid kinase